MRPRRRTGSGGRVARRLPALAAVIAMAVVAVLVPPGPSAAADTTASELTTGWEALTDSASLSSSPAATGVLDDTSGSPVADAPVILFAEPSNASLDQMQVGDTAEVIPLSRATTGADGSWALRVPDDLNLAGFAQPDDSGLYSVNVIAQGFDNVGSSAYGFTMHIVPKADSPLPPPNRAPGISPGRVRAATTTTTTSDVPADETEVATTDWDGSTVPVSVPSGTTATLTDADMSVTPDVSVPGGLKPCNPPYCTGCQLQKLAAANVTTHVGSLYASSDGSSQTFSYTRGSTSSLGEGISLSGSYGSWKQSGTSSMSSSVTETYPTLSGQGFKYYYTQFRYGKYRMNCWKFTPTGNGDYTKKRYILGYWWQATGYEGGATSSNTSGIIAGKCVVQEGGSKYTINKTHAYDWVGGADSSGILGFWLSARTGYSTSTSIHMSFSKGRYLCGKYDYPGGSPQLLLVKN